MMGGQNQVYFRMMLSNKTLHCFLLSCISIFAPEAQAVKDTFIYLDTKGKAPKILFPVGSHSKSVSIATERPRIGPKLISDRSTRTCP